MLQEYEARYGVFDENKNRHGEPWLVEDVQLRTEAALQVCSSGHACLNAADDKDKELAILQKASVALLR